MSTPAAPGRVVVGLLTLGLVAAIVLFDLATSPRIDPFRVPPPAALGSGLAASAAHCAITTN